jgi:hypothetical protein
MATLISSLCSCLTMNGEGFASFTTQLPRSLSFPFGKEYYVIIEDQKTVFRIRIRIRFVSWIRIQLQMKLAPKAKKIILFRVI